MTWTTTPDRAGFWWRLVPGASPVVARVSDLGDGVWEWYADGQWASTIGDHDGVLWAGPLTPPEPPR